MARRLARVTAPLRPGSTPRCGWSRRRPPLPARARPHRALARHPRRPRHHQARPRRRRRRRAPRRLRRRRHTYGIRSGASLTAPCWGSGSCRGHTASTAVVRRRPPRGVFRRTARSGSCWCRMTSKHAGCTRDPTGSAPWRCKTGASASGALGAGMTRLGSRQTAVGTAAERGQTWCIHSSTSPYPRRHPSPPCRQRRLWVRARPCQAATPCWINTQAGLWRGRAPPSGTASSGRCRPTLFLWRLLWTPAGGALRRSRSRCTAHRGVHLMASAWQPTSTPRAGRRWC